MATKTTPKKADEPKTRTQLQEELKAKRQDLLDAKRAHAAGELVNPRVLARTRKEIARLLTAIRTAEPEAKKESK